ncbi:MAG: hypothetical protein ACRDJC_20360 [Thermomicrobiales bacterium]
MATASIATFAPEGTQTTEAALVPWIVVLLRPAPRSVTSLSTSKPPA